MHGGASLVLARIPWTGSRAPVEIATGLAGCRGLPLLRRGRSVRAPPRTPSGRPTPSERSDRAVRRPPSAGAIRRPPVPSPRHDAARGGHARPKRVRGHGATARHGWCRTHLGRPKGGAAAGADRRARNGGTALVQRLGVPVLGRHVVDRRKQQIDRWPNTATAVVRLQQRIDGRCCECKRARRGRLLCVGRSLQKTDGPARTTR